MWVPGDKEDRAAFIQTQLRSADMGVEEQSNFRHEEQEASAEYEYREDNLKGEELRPCPLKWSRQ
jgi:hypothetical protein